MITVIPYIPSEITVHLGTPSSSAPNVTVSFPDYVKNVASSEIYPTWEVSALRSNILAIISYAANRVYTEYYRSRGYNFDITSSTAYDQSFVNGRNYFDSIVTIVDEIFNDYLRRTGFVEPLAASFCNGTTSTCDGLSQWGSQSLAVQGYNSVQILQAYYGEDIEVVADAPVQDIIPSYPGSPIRMGDVSEYVVVIQVSLNRISQAYPAIPKINPVTGVFGESTEQSVRTFQQIFSLTVDGIVGNATWYKLVFLYVAITKLNELQSQGQTFYEISWEFPETLSLGSTGERVNQLQYVLSVLAFFISAVPTVSVTGTYDEATQLAVRSFQQYKGLEQTGETDPLTWDAIYNTFMGIDTTVLNDPLLFPATEEPQAATTVAQLQKQLQAVSAMYPNVSAPSSTGRWDRQTQRSLAQTQSAMGLPRTGKVDPTSKSALIKTLTDGQYSKSSQFMQFPGFHLSFGMQDPIKGGTKWKK